MLFDFNKVFYKTREEHLLSITKMIDIFEKGSMNKDCETCKHFKSTIDSGMTHDYVECEKKCMCFKNKILNRKKVFCKDYEQNLDYMNNMKAKIHRLEDNENKENLERTVDL